MSRTIVGVLRGGTSSEYDLSLKSGAAMIAALPADRYLVRDILVDKSGTWYAQGVPATPVRALSQVDVVLNALHGGVGEDGTVARLMQQIGLPYANSTALASGMSLNKARARQVFASAGILIPKGIAFRVSSGITTGEMAKVVFRQFAPPYIVKPTQEGASHGIRIANTVLDLPDVLGDALDQYGAALVEEYVRGHQASVGIIENFRNEKTYALPPAHTTLPFGARFIAREHHVSGNLRHRVPSNFSDIQKQQMMTAAKMAHDALGLTHASLADFIVTPNRVYLLEVDSNPHLFSGAVFPSMLEAVGSSVPDFLQHSIALARAR